MYLISFKAQIKNLRLRSTIVNNLTLLYYLKFVLLTAAGLHISNEMGMNRNNYSNSI